MHSDWALRKLQFRTLYRVFLLRLVDLELLSADGDPTKLIGHFASIFATFSFCLTAPVLLMNGNGLQMTQAWMFEHFFIETAMTAAGLIAVLNWDAAFPDRRDVMVLAPLPVKRSTLLLAKIAALFAAPALAILALNIFSGVIWPPIFRSPNAGLVGVLRSWPAYWITIFAGGSLLCVDDSGVTGIGGQSAATTALPSSVCDLASGQLVPLTERLLSRAVAGITRGPCFPAKSAAARVASLLLVPCSL